MKKNHWKAWALALAAGVLAGCGTQGQPAPAPGAAPPAQASAQCRIVDGADTGELLLASQGDNGEIYWLDVSSLPVTLDGGQADRSALRDGMLVTVWYDGSVQETWPAGFSGASRLEAFTQGVDDRCGLVLQVFEHLWNKDEALNEGIQYAGVNISAQILPCAAERAAVAWRFAQLHGLTPVQGDWEELCEQGYVDEEEWRWPDGCMFSIQEHTDIYNDKGEESYPPASAGAVLRFDAQKWRSALGAYMFSDCTAEQREDGGWSYQVGGEAIS